MLPQKRAPREPAPEQNDGYSDHAILQVGSHGQAHHRHDERRGNEIDRNRSIGRTVGDGARADTGKDDQIDRRLRVREPAGKHRNAGPDQAGQGSKKLKPPDLALQIRDMLNRHLTAVMGNCLEETQRIDEIDQREPGNCLPEMPRGDLHHQNEHRKNRADGHRETCPLADLPELVRKYLVGYRTVVTAICRPDQLKPICSFRPHRYATISQSTFSFF